MDTMIKENECSFKDLEKEIFRFICGLGIELTREILEKYDQHLHDTRDKSALRDKGTRETSVKTVYGAVPYSRHVYQTRDEYGTSHFVYLLDDNLRLGNVGLVSENYVEMIVASITEMSYRNCAEKVTDMTGMPISHTAVWNIIQSLGNKLETEEKKLVSENKCGHIKGSKDVPVLFEEADGVWLNLQGKDRERRNFDKAEMKAAIAYDGWKNEGSGRYSLDGKVVTAGFEKAAVFHNKREAMIAAQYNLDEVELRLMNGDGAAWIKKTQDKETVFQLDPFHRNKSIKENIRNPKAVRDLMELLEECKVVEVLEYLKIYIDSIADPEEERDAEKLLTYFMANREGLIPYQKMDMKIPDPPEGLEYRGMGTMENHIWSIIARRMKHNHTSWSINGGNHLAKILAKKCSGKLNEVTERLRVPMFEEEVITEIRGEILSAARVQKTVGKGYLYPTIGKLVFEDGPKRGEGRLGTWEINI